MDEPGQSGEFDALETEQKKPVDDLRHLAAYSVALLPFWTSMFSMFSGPWPAHWIDGILLGSCPLSFLAFFIIDGRYHRVVALLIGFAWFANFTTDRATLGL